MGVSGTYMPSMISVCLSPELTQTGLLPLLKSIQRPTELKKFEGKTLGVDGYGWLHRAAYSCAVELGQGQPTTKSATSPIKRLVL
jgi:exonuclease 1